MSFLLSPARSASRSSILQSASSISRSFSTTSSAALAKMSLLGRVGSDPEVMTARNGTEVVRYTMATNYGYKENRQTSWFNVASFSKKDSPGREKLMGISKGTLVYLEADATMKSYEDSEGKKLSSLSLVQTRLEVLKRPVPRQDAESGTQTEEGEGMESTVA